jgi:hypothetical protein
MKTTHTIQDVEGLLLEKVILLKTAETKEERVKIQKQIQKLEKHLNDCNDKHINGKKYPERMQGFPDDKPMDQKLLKKLIDESLDFPNDKVYGEDTEDVIEYNKDINGVFVTDPTTKDYDKYWKTPKQMTPSPYFK